MVVVFDYVGLNDGNLEAAIETSRANFQREGVATNWSVCHRAEGRREKCTLPAEGSFVTINLVPQMKSALAGIAASNFLGWSIRDSVADGRPIAYVFHRPVTASAAKAGQPLRVALAWAMVHEVSHLLGLNHAPSGVMRASPQTRDLLDVARGLGFAPCQGKQLHSGASRLYARATLP